MSEPKQFVPPKTYMIIADRATNITTFCTISGVKNSLNYWINKTYVSKAANKYLIYKFNKKKASYELKFDGQRLADLFIDDPTAREKLDYYNVIIDTLK